MTGSTDPTGHASRADLTGTVSTVLGSVPASELGIVLPHEHVLVDLRKRFSPPGDAAEVPLSAAPVGLGTLGWVRFNQEKSLDNLHLSDRETAVLELLPYRLLGGGTVVDLTPAHAGRDIEGLRYISRATGVAIVMGTGFYLDPFHDEGMRRMSPAALADRLVADISEGIGPDRIRAGIIGEMGCSWPLTADERKALVAAALAQQRTGAPVSVHPGRHPDAPAEIVDVLLGAGADPCRVVICHIDRTLPTLDAVLAIARRGVLVEIDLFGQESSHIRYGQAELPSDVARIRRMCEIADAGFAAQLLLSQDIALKHHLAAYGGHGYAHLLARVLPRMREMNVRQELVDQVMRVNPARLLALPAASSADNNAERTDPPTPVARSAAQ